MVVSLSPCNDLHVRTNRRGPNPLTPTPESRGKPHPPRASSDRNRGTRVSPSPRSFAVSPVPSGPGRPQLSSTAETPLSAGRPETVEGTCRVFLLSTSSPVSAHLITRALRGEGFKAVPTQRRARHSVVAVLCTAAQHDKVLKIAKEADPGADASATQDANQAGEETQGATDRRALHLAILSGAVCRS